MIRRSKKQRLMLSQKNKTKKKQKKTQNNYDHIPHKDSEEGDKLTSGKCFLKSFTCVIGSGRLLSLILT